MKLNLGKDLYIKGRIGWRGLSKDEYLEKSDYRIINATSLEDGYINWNKCGYISKERYDESPEIMLQENDILISKDGTLGKIGYVKNLHSPCTVASGIFVLRNTTDFLNFDYLYHVLKSNIFKNFIFRNKTLGSTINHLYQRDLENFEIELPCMENQNKIANILNELDDKINLNNKVNSELESIIKTIYDYWFFQFEFPDKEGKPYKSNEGKMIWNEVLKREIPEGWVIEKLEDVLDKIIDHRGLTPKKLNDDWSDTGIKAISAKCVKNGKLVNLNSANHVSEKLYKKWMPVELMDGDILMTSEAPLGEFYFILHDEKFCLSQRLFAMRCNEVVKPIYMYYELSKGYAYSQIMGGKSGSTVFGIRQDELRKIKVLIPNIEIQTIFEQKTLDIYTEIRNNEYENRKLESIRDFLLPLLMNGQVTFKEGDKNA